MAKELMEIGGFITEGAEIVNHDNTLSGNGTVDSPLGLNETVLWTNPDNSTNPNINLSEPLNNFDYIRFDYALSPSNIESIFSYSEISCNIPTSNIMVNKQICLNGMMPDGRNTGTMVIRNIIYIISNDATTLTFDKAYQLYFNGSSWATGSTNNMVVYKVVGINRIANN